MKLSQLAAKPQLIKIQLEDEETRTAYGDVLEFYVYDRQDMETFVKMATLDVKDFDKVADIVNRMILDETGQQIVRDGLVLPTNIMMKAIHKVVEVLGKPQKPTINK